MGHWEIPTAECMRDREREEERDGEREEERDGEREGGSRHSESVRETEEEESKGLYTLHTKIETRLNPVHSDAH